MVVPLSILITNAMLENWTATHMVVQVLVTEDLPNVLSSIILFYHLQIETCTKVSCYCLCIHYHYFEIPSKR